jgi:hypothetical protein
MTRIAISVFVLSLVCGPSGAAQSPDHETSRPGIDVEANLLDPSDDQRANEPLGAAAVGDTAPVSSRMKVRAWPADPSPTRLIVFHSYFGRVSTVRRYYWLIVPSDAIAKA